MGVNCNVYLPTDVGLDHVAQLAGILAGLKAEQEDIGQHGRPCIVTRVAGARTNAKNGIDGMSDIVLTASDGETLVDGEDAHTAYFHYCSRRNGKVYNMLSPTSNVFWCAVSRGLVRWFGGIVVYNDCGYEKGKNVFRAKRGCPVDARGLIPDDGQPWNDYQTALFKVKPLTMRDIRTANTVAGYKLERHPATV